MLEIYLDDVKKISLDEFLRIIENNVKLSLSVVSQKKIQRSEDFLKSLLTNNMLIYGINTGYGPLATTHIPPEQIDELQKNLIYHLATGVGENFSDIHVKAILLARILCLSKGYSAIRLSSLNLLINLFNLEIYPCIPRLGTVGASGDLTPLAHMVLALMGESTVKFRGKIQPSKKVFKKLNIAPLKLTSKEGLAFVNGTSVMTGLAAVNGVYAERALDFAISLSILFAEIMEAKEEAFHELIGFVKPHKGMKYVLKLIKQRVKLGTRFRKRKLKSKTGITFENELIQDIYSIRCIPQILGAVYDSIFFHNEVVTIELNSVTDNPIFFSSEKIVLHGGNFQGHSVALASDALYNAITNLAIHSERKIARITDVKLNNGLPPFLQGNNPGLQSGFMGAQVTATALLAWIKSNATPSSIQSISTNANNQDVVSMGTIAALKTSESIDRVFEVLAIDAMVMAQAFELKNGFDKSSGFSAHSMEFVNRIRKYSPFLGKDRSLSLEIKTLSEKMKLGLF